VGDYTVQMRWKGTCGYSQYTTKTIRIPENSFYSYSAAYPNPAGNELIIDREETDNETQQANNATVKVLLYSHSTTKLAYSKDFPASAQQIKIDTSQLPDGIYYLNIISNNEKIKEQTIIVKH
ncbi:MAG: T9SS type A sorting domain-containing protein, partial [Prevotellaceae bacterium]|nr:T9SS type A sorting domain-containing protein [Prevotellaceae bacterium]